MPPERASSVRSRKLRPLLRLPLFYKILLANVAIVVAGAGVGTWIAVRLARGNPSLSVGELVAVLAALGAAVSVTVNALILRLALRPLRLLEETVEQVRGGSSDVRVPASPLADRHLEHLTSTFNEMLDTLSRYRKRLRAVARRAINSAERERLRIARELHDDTAQRLASLQLRIKSLIQVDDPAECAHRLDEIGAHLREAAESIRRLARGLRPPALDDLGLISAVRTYARSQSDTFEVPVHIEGSGDPPLPPDVALALYRIVQEAVSNALRHGEPDRVRIIFEERPEELKVMVEDDGTGFRPGEVMASESAGLGLSGMRERASYVNGNVRIESEPGEGTRVRVTVPTGMDEGTAGGSNDLVRGKSPRRAVPESTEA